MKYIKQEKIDKIELNKDNMYLVIDFDKTITAADSMDSWDVTGKNLSEEFNKKINELYEKYRPIELDYKISTEEKYAAMENWYNAVINLYFEYNLRKIDVEKSVKENYFKFRKGAKEFLNYMHKNNIPVIILSAGIGNSIKLFLDENDCLYNNMCIISNFIKFDKKGNMKEFEGQIIHSLNKNIRHELPKRFHKTIQNRKYSLLIGDSIEDKKMVEQEQLENTITVGLLSENIKNNLVEYRKNFDIVLTKEDANFQTIKGIVTKSY